MAYFWSRQVVAELNELASLGQQHAHQPTELTTFYHELIVQIDCARSLSNVDL